MRKLLQLASPSAAIGKQERKYQEHSQLSEPSKIELKNLHFRLQICNLGLQTVFFQLYNS